MLDHGSRPTIFLLLPDVFSVRNFLFTPIWARLCGETAYRFVVFIPFPVHRKIVEDLGQPHIHFQHLGESLVPPDGGVRQRTLLQKVCQSLAFRVLAHVMPNVMRWRLVYRFNRLQGFATHRTKSNWPEERKRREYSVADKLGWPFSDSRLVFNLMSALYHSSLQPIPNRVKNLFDHYRPVLVVLTHLQVQLKASHSYMLCCRRRGVPVVGFVNSWDHLTTKGPLYPGIRRFLVWNDIMREELIRFHGVDAAAIHATGAPQTDLYADPNLLQGRENFLASLGVPEHHRLITYGTYSERLGPHEPDIASYLARQVADDRYTYPCTLLIRTHPKDFAWEERFGHLRSMRNVIVQRASNLGLRGGYETAARIPDDLRMLADLMKHSDIVIAGPGTLILDAIAFDTCAINIGFDGNKPLSGDVSIRAWYDFDHYVPIIKARGTKLVESYTELDDAINTYLRHPEEDATGRARIRREQFGSIDGKASDRIVDYILEAAAEFTHTP